MVKEEVSSLRRGADVLRFPLSLPERVQRSGSDERSPLSLRLLCPGIKFVADQFGDEPALRDMHAWSNYSGTEGSQVQRD